MGLTRRDWRLSIGNLRWQKDGEKTMMAIFAVKVITFEPDRFQKSYSLRLIICYARNFSTIFEVNQIGTPSDIAPRVKVLADGMFIRVMWRMANGDGDRC
jgi:hypothetical protein